MSLRTPILADALHHIDLEAIKREKGEANWSHSLVATDHVRSTLICQKPGTETDNLLHDYDEWWGILEGEIHWKMEGEDDLIVAKKGDFVFAPALKFHHISPAGDGPSIRLAVSMPGKGHLHERPAGKVKVTFEDAQAVPA